jgi:hypothetical protein
MPAEQLAELIHTTIRNGTLPDSLKSFIPPEAAKLSKKQLVKLVQTL